MTWCDMCEKEVKGKVHKLGDGENTIYLCDKDWRLYKRDTLDNQIPILSANIQSAEEYKEKMTDMLNKVVKRNGKSFNYRCNRIHRQGASS